MSEIKEPFLTVLRLGGSVDYKDKGTKTHEFIENMFVCEQNASVDKLKLLKSQKEFLGDDE